MLGAPGHAGLTHYRHLLRLRGPGSIGPGRARGSQFHLYRRLLGQVRPYWPHLAGLVLLNLLATPLALLTPLPLKIAVDSVLGSQPLPGFLELLVGLVMPRSNTATLILAASLLVLIALLSQLFELAKALLQAYTGEKLVLDFRSRLFRHVQRLSLAYHDTHGTSDSTYRIQYDTPSIQWITIDGAMGLVSAAFTLAGMIYVSARIDWQLALVALGASPVLLLVSRVYGQRMRSQWSEVKVLESATLSVVQEVLTSLRVVKAFGQENREQERFDRRSSEDMRARVGLECFEAGFGLIMGLVTAAGAACVLFIGVHHVQSGVLSLGELLMVMTYLLLLYVPLQTISKKAGDVQASLVGAERAFALLDEAPDVVERPSARPLARGKGAVAFRDVSFAYLEAQPVLRAISFEIPLGTRVGIAGATGAGKTTLVSLLTRFYDPTTGSIFLDGVDLRDYRVADLRNQFAIVLQEPLLFSTSIGDNIAYSRPGASAVDIVQAAEAAKVHEFIASLPRGYDTQVGERGMRLSGGERQRISLARAFLKDAPILILDEPTSSVDVRTEVAIIEAMERLMKGRTSFMIAHRLSMLETCDLLMVIERGRLVTVTSDVSGAIRNELELRARMILTGGEV